MVEYDRLLQDLPYDMLLLSVGFHETGAYTFRNRNGGSDCHGGASPRESIREVSV